MRSQADWWYGRNADNEAQKLYFNLSATHRQKYQHLLTISLINMYYSLPFKNALPTKNRQKKSTFGIELTILKLKYSIVSIF